MSGHREKPTIAIDIDDVLFPFVVGVAKHYNGLKGAALTPADFFSFNFDEVWGGTVEESVEIVYDFLSTDCLALQPVAGAQEVLGRLKEDFNLVLVTARNDEFRPQTASWLQQHFPGLFRDVVFAGNHYDNRGFRAKGDICKELGADLLIDDHPKNILSAVEAGISGILFGEKAWTVMGELPDSSVRYCKDWRAVEKYIYDEWRTR